MKKTIEDFNLNFNPPKLDHRNFGRMPSWLQDYIIEIQEKIEEYDIFCRTKIENQKIELVNLQNARKKDGETIIEYIEFKKSVMKIFKSMNKIFKT